ncbi:glycoside hydrolase family 18 protein [Francisella philomiragia]|uniref:glycoside hydrolase family 18 protein n=1 Tax=Francisella philomiragia TaxID=28110 RepID=UPI001C9DFC96|nr:glycoside hydrolase family 18 protein [Francisella philomiragia]MBY7734191.1 glycoside hydrolase family 18 protein [Francisella philomiragia]
MSLRKIKRTVIATLVGLSTYSASNAANVTAYYPNWGTYEANYQPSDIPAQHVDEIVYAFAQVGNCAQPYATDDNPELCNASDPNSGYFKGGQDYKLYSTDPYADFKKIPSDYYHPKDWDGGKGIIGEVLYLGKPVVLSVGGWSLSVPLFKAMDDQHRAGFVKSVVRFFEQVKNDTGKTFAGIDVDWEPNENSWSFVNTSTGRQQLQNYIDLIKDLKSALPKGQNKVGIAAPASPTVIKNVDAVYPEFWKKITNEVDIVNVMSYDYHGAWDVGQVTNFNAPLYYDNRQPADVTGRETFNNVATIEAYVNAGVSPAKMNLGIPAYGRTYSNVEASTTQGLYQPFNGAAITPSGDGTLRYTEIQKNAGGFNWVTNQDYLAGQATAYDSNKKAFITFDNPASVVNKVSIAKNNGLNGVMFWDLSGDYKIGDADFAQKSLIKAAKES